MIHSDCETKTCGLLKTPWHELLPGSSSRKGIIHPEILAVTILVTGMAVFAVPEAFVTAPAPDVVSESEDLWMMRTAIALYRIEHNDKLPGEANPLLHDLLPYLPKQDRQRLAARFHPESIVVVQHESMLGETPPSSARWQYDLNSGGLHTLH